MNEIVLSEEEEDMNLLYTNLGSDENLEQNITKNAINTSPTHLITNTSHTSLP